MTDKHTDKSINLKLLAEVLQVHSISHTTQMNEVLNVTYRDTEDDNSSWFDLDIYALGYLYKHWAKDKGYNILSDTFGAYVTKLPKQSINDCDFSILHESEIKAVRLVTEELYEKIKED